MFNIVHYKENHSLNLNRQNFGFGFTRHATKSNLFRTFCYLADLLLLPELLLLIIHI